jgi:hypothetical protein
MLHFSTKLVHFFLGVQSSDLLCASMPSYCTLFWWEADLCMWNCIQYQTGSICIICSWDEGPSSLYASSNSHDPHYCQHKWANCFLQWLRNYYDLSDASSWNHTTILKPNLWHSCYVHCCCELLLSLLNLDALKNKIKDLLLLIQVRKRRRHSRGTRSTNPNCTREARKKCKLIAATRRKKMSQKKLLQHAPENAWLAQKYAMPQ